MAKATLRKSGTSLVFTIPVPIADQIHAIEGSEFDMVLDVPRKTLNFKKVN